MIEAKRQQRIMRSSAMSNMRKEKMFEKKLNFILRIRGKKEELETRVGRDALVRAVVKTLGGRNDQDVVALPLRHSNWYWSSSVSSKIKFSTSNTSSNNKFNNHEIADIAICLSLSSQQNAKDVLRNVRSKLPHTKLFSTSISCDIVSEGHVKVSEGMGRIRLGARSGLVIECALYGTIAGCSGAVNRKRREDDEEEQECLDVTIALQFQVRDSRLELPGNISKSDFLGFANPRKRQAFKRRRKQTNENPLRLVIEYTFEKKRYRYVCPETFPLVLPNITATCMGDASRVS